MLPKQITFKPNDQFVKNQKPPKSAQASTKKKKGLKMLKKAMSKFAK